MILKIQVKESSESLLNRIRGSRNVEEKDKLRLLKLIVDNEVSEIQEAANKLFRHRNTVSNWLNKYRKGGIKELIKVNKRGKHLGYLKYLNKKQLSRLKEELNNTEGFNSYKEIQIWIKKELKVDIPYDTMWNLVRKRLKAKLKTPRPVNINKDLVKEEAFKKTLLMS